MKARSVGAAVASVLLGLGGCALPARAQEANGAPERYLRRMGLGPAQIDSVAHGHAVVRLLAATNDREVAVFGGIRVDGSRDVLRARALDVERLLAGSGNRFHLFGSPATAGDVQEAALDPSEYRALRDCKPGDCNFKMPSSAMKAFLQQVNWASSDAKSQADQLLRTDLLQLVAAYRARGNAATPSYDDANGVRPGEVFTELVAQSPEVYEYAPALQQYLNSYPSGRPAPTRDLLYWSELRLPHLRPLLTVNHIVVYAPAHSTAFVARKQIYASHYFEGAFELLAVADAGAEADSGVYLFVLRRFRFDSLPAGLMNVRGRVRQELVGATRSDLERERSLLAGTSTP